MILQKIHLIISYLGAVLGAVVAGIMILFLEEDGYAYQTILSLCFGLIWFLANLYFNVKSHHFVFKSKQQVADLLDFDDEKERFWKFSGQISVGIIILIMSILLLFVAYFMHLSIGIELTYQETTEYIYPFILGTFIYLGLLSPVFVIWT